MFSCLCSPSPSLKGRKILIAFNIIIIIIIINIIIIISCRGSSGSSKDIHSLSDIKFILINAVYLYK
jgi:hypothetical protein